MLDLIANYLGIRFGSIRFLALDASDSLPSHFPQLIRDLRTRIGPKWQRDSAVRIAVDLLRLLDFDLMYAPHGASAFACVRPLPLPDLLPHEFAHLVALWDDARFKNPSHSTSAHEERAMEFVVAALSGWDPVLGPKYRDLFGGALRHWLPQWGESALAQLYQARLLGVPGFLRIPEADFRWSAVTIPFLHSLPGQCTCYLTPGRNFHAQLQRCLNDHQIVAWPPAKIDISSFCRTALVGTPSSAFQADRFLGSMVHAALSCGQLRSSGTAHHFEPIATAAIPLPGDRLTFRWTYGGNVPPPHPRWITDLPHVALADATRARLLFPPPTVNWQDVNCRVCRSRQHLFTGGTDCPSRRCDAKGLVGLHSQSLSYVP